MGCPLPQGAAESACIRAVLRFQPSIPEAGGRACRKSLAALLAASMLLQSGPCAVLSAAAGDGGAKDRRRAGAAGLASAADDLRGDPNNFDRGLPARGPAASLPAAPAMGAAVEAADSRWLWFSSLAMDDRDPAESRLWSNAAWALGQERIAGSDRAKAGELRSARERLQKALRAASFADLQDALGEARKPASWYRQKADMLLSLGAESQASDKALESWLRGNLGRPDRDGAWRGSAQAALPDLARLLGVPAAAGRAAEAARAWGSEAASKAEALKAEFDARAKPPAAGRQAAPKKPAGTAPSTADGPAVAAGLKPRTAAPAGAAAPASAPAGAGWEERFVSSLSPVLCPSCTQGVSPLESRAGVTTVAFGPGGAIRSGGPAGGGGAPGFLQDGGAAGQDGLLGGIFAADGSIGRLASAAAGSGALQLELDSSRARGRRLAEELRQAKAALARAEAAGLAPDPEGQAGLSSRIEALRRSRDELYILSKLAEKADLLQGTGAGSELAAMDELLKLYDGVLPGGGAAGAGLVEAGEARWAELSALRRVLDRMKEGALSPGSRPPGPAPLAGTPRERAVEEALSKVEGVNSRLQAELAAKEAAGQMLAVADRIRGGALSQRRSNEEMLEFRKNFSRLAMVMDLSYSLNILNSAEAAVNGMIGLLDRKLSSIEEQRKRSSDLGARARDNLGKVDDWRRTTDGNVAKDKDNKATFASLADKAALFIENLAALRTDVPAILRLIDARDKGRSPNALAEYRRRLELLPALRGYKEHGYPSDSGQLTQLSLDRLRSESQKARGYLADIERNEGKLDQVPVEFAGLLVVAVPGIPAVQVSNPTAGDVARILAERRAYWEPMRADFRKYSQNMRDALDAGLSRRSPDDFGDPRPDSLVVYMREEREAMEKAQSELAELTRRIDEAARRAMEAASAGSLPMLAGRPVRELRDLLPQYGDAIERLSFPETDAGFRSKMAMVTTVRILPYIGDAAIRYCESEKRVEALQAGMAVVQKVQPAFDQAASAMEQLMADVDADEAYLDAGMPAEQGAALIERKRRLVFSVLKPMIKGMQEALDNVLIPYQEREVAKADPASPEDGFKTLYAKKIELYEKVRDLYDRKFPWSVAANGAPYGDAGAARAAIEAQRRTFQDYSKMLLDYKEEVRRRRDPDDTGVEEVYGETMPFSLVRRIEKYRAEGVAKTASVNAAATQVNAILADIDRVTGGRYGLAAKYALPTGFRADVPADVAAMLALGRSKRIQALADALEAVGKEAQAAAGGTDISIGGGGTSIPNGRQPDIDVSNAQKTALLCLEGVKRLVPTSQTGGDGTSLAESLARVLLADAVVESSRKGLEERIPAFDGLLTRADAVLAEVFADFDLDLAYTASPESQSGEAVLDRKARLFGRVRDIATEAAVLFGEKAGWDQEGHGTIDLISEYYNSMDEVYTRSGDALDAEEDAARQYRDTLKKTADQLAQQKSQVTSWLKQLNDPHESALSRIQANLSALQDKTRLVLEANVNYHKLLEQFQAADGRLQQTLKSLDLTRADLKAALDGISLDDLPEPLAARVTALTQGDAWLAAGPRDPPALVIRKSEFNRFLDALFGGFTPESSTRDVLALRQELLRNPMALAQMLPNSRVLEIGDDSNGFYLVYNTKFSVPHALETTSSVTMGNVLRLWDNNVSVTGYRFASPPAPGNAPFGDQGISVTIESLQGKNWVNYLDITLHKFIQDVPRDLAAFQQAADSRMMIFDDFAMMLVGDRLYVGAAGFADFALKDAEKKPYYYGGNLKASVKFTEVMRLNAEHAELFAKDPRSFFQKVNLDFTKWDPTLNQDFIIDAHGEQKELRRDKLGVGLDVGRAIRSKDAFTVDFYYSRVTGTDDISQAAYGATVLKGFSFDLAGVPVNTTVQGTGELGEKYDTYSGRVSFELPKQGIVFSATGKALGDASTYFLELQKRLGANTSAFVSWGSPYVGLNHRLTIGTQTSFTLGELWRAVAGKTADNLAGGQPLRRFQEDLDGFFLRDDPNNPLIAELGRVFQNDVGKKLLSLEVGTLSSDLEVLARAGALLDNTRIRGMIGFVSRPVDDSTAGRAVGGGFQTGTLSELTLTKTQRALIESKIQGIYASGLRLQARLLELTRLWQETVTELLEAQWELQLAMFMAVHGQHEAIRREGDAKVAIAVARYRQAQLRYNLLTARGPDAPTPFEDANPNDLDYLMAQLGRALSSTNRVSILLHAADPSALGVAGKGGGFNLMDWIPWVESLTFYMGVQFQDLLSNQVLGGGIRVRLPVYDPNSAHKDMALTLDSQALAAEMLTVYKDYRLRARQEVLEASAYDAQLGHLAREAPAAAQGLSYAISGYRNGLVRQDELWAAFERWHWAVSRLLDARARASLKSAWAVLDAHQSSGGLTPYPIGETVDTGGLDSVASAVARAEQGLSSLDALALRSQAARELMAAASRRVNKVVVDINAGVNVTADGVSFIPAFGITGLGIFPIVGIEWRPEELSELEQAQHGAEAEMFGRMKGLVKADVALQFFQSYSAYKTGLEAQGIYEREMLPQRQAAAAAGDSRARLELAKAQADYEALKGQNRQSLSAVNFLLNRSLAAPLEMDQGLDAALAEMQARFRGSDPVADRLAVLRKRVETARAVEQIVDKNLKLQNVRLEPFSLVGRALGRLIAALSGSGDASPEAVALARIATLDAERGLAAFEKELPAARLRLQARVTLVQNRLQELSGRDDAPSRIEALSLRNQLLGLKAQLAALGSSPEADAASASGDVPGSFADLKRRLTAAIQAENPPMASRRGLAASEPEDLAQAQGVIRYYDARMTLSKDPIGKQFLEGWVEVRLASRSTPPEALVALARLQKERADDIAAASASAAQAKAGMLLARFKVNVELLRWVRREAAANPEAAKLAASIEETVKRDYAAMASHLGLGMGRLEEVAALVPAGAPAEPGAVADEFLREVGAVNIELLKRTLFEKGLPAGLSGSQDALVQLKANLVAERMSYKGFTPVGVFGVFRGRWVSGAFLEAPDPSKIEKGLENILADALRRELEAQGRLKGLALRVHSLMAAVSDNSKLVAALGDRLDASSRNLQGTLVLFKRGMAPAEAVAGAQAQVAAAWSDFVEAVIGLRVDFVALVTEMEALGLSSRPDLAGGPLSSMSRPPARGPFHREGEADLLRWWSERMLDRGFEAGLDALFDGSALLPSAKREELGRLVAVYRLMSEDAAAVRHMDFSDPEKLELLTKADVEGRRQKVEAALRDVLASLGRQDPANTSWMALYGFLSSDLEVQASQAGAGVVAQRALSNELRKAFWEAVPAPAPVAAAYRRLMDLNLGVEAAWTDLLLSYAEHDGKPEDFLLKNVRLDAYLKALTAYDESVVAAFADPALRGSPSHAKALNALFSLGASAARRRDLLRHGRGILAISALLQAENARLDGLRYEEASPLRVAPVSQRIAFLEAMKARWLADPASVETVVALVRPAESPAGDSAGLTASHGHDSGGRAAPLEERLVEWLTASEVAGMRRAGRVVEAGGRTFLLPPALAGAAPGSAAELAKAGAMELVLGVDARRDQAEAARREAGLAANRRKAEARLKEAEFLLVDESADDAPLRELTLAELRSLESQGRVLYFSARPNRLGLRAAVHPLAAQRMSPTDLLAYVKTSEGGVPADRFPSLEALKADAAFAEFGRLVAGPRGAQAIVREMRGRELRSARGGWINMKLEAYAFALDPAGKVAAVYMTEGELKAAREKAAAEECTDEVRRATGCLKDRTFHLASALALGFDREGTLLAVRLDGKRLIPLGDGAAALEAGEALPGVETWIAGELLAVELDAQGRARRLFTDRGELERAARAWWIEDMEGRVWETTNVMSPIARLKRYIDPSTRLPVILGRSFLMRYAQAAAGELKAVERWKYMPWNWHNIVLETPRGIVSVPVELLTGRDPNQHGYIGRVYMYRGEGGATQRRGALGSIVHFVDILGILPDKVERYQDPSQFPGTVRTDGPLKPGEAVFEKDPQTEELNVKFGALGLLRRVRYAEEDLEDARNRILGAFDGSVRTVFVETVRGRAGTYAEAKVEHKTGADAVAASLKELEVSPDGTASLQVEPGHIEVDAVQAELQIQLGSSQYKAQREAYEALAAELEASAGQGATPEELRERLRGIEEALRREEARRRGVTALNAAAGAAERAFKRTIFPPLFLVSSPAGS